MLRWLVIRSLAPTRCRSCDSVHMLPGEHYRRVTGAAASGELPRRVALARVAICQAPVRVQQAVQQQAGLGARRCRLPILVIWWRFGEPGAGLVGRGGRAV